MFKELLHTVFKNLVFFSLCVADFVINIGRNATHAFSNAVICFRHLFKLLLPFFRAFKSKLVLIWLGVCIVCTITVLFLLSLTVNYYQISYNGQNVGYVRNIDIPNDALTALKTEFKDNGTVLQDLEKFEVKEIQTNQLFLSCFRASEMKDVLIDVADSIEYAYGVYANKEALIYAINLEYIENAVNNYKNSRINAFPSVAKKHDSYEIEWLVPFEIKRECVSVDKITTKHVYSDLYLELEVKLPYRITCIQTVNESVPFMTQYERNTYLYAQSKKVVKSGKNGIKAVKSKIIFENGEQISSEVLEEKMTKEPVNKVVEIGSSYDKFSDTGKVLLPVEGYLTSPFGMRKDPFTGKPAHHNGLDIAAATGTDIWAVAAGKVIKASDTGNGYGKCVIIEHYSGFRTLYAHCSELLVSVGDYVKSGDVIAKVGSTGRSTGPHLHFSIIINGEYVDPNLYF